MFEDGAKAEEADQLKMVLDRGVDAPHQQSSRPITGLSETPIRIHRSLGRKAAFRNQPVCGCNGGLPAVGMPDTFGFILAGVSGSTALLASGFRGLTTSSPLRMA